MRRLDPAKVGTYYEDVDLLQYYEIVGYNSRVLFHKVCTQMSYLDIQCYSTHTYLHGLCRRGRYFR